jgi:hypothetical protein
MTLRGDIQTARRRMLNAQEALLLDAFAGSRDPEVQESLVAEMDQETAAFLELIASIRRAHSLECRIRLAASPNPLCPHQT